MGAVTGALRVWSAQSRQARNAWSTPGVHLQLPPCGLMLEQHKAVKRWSDRRHPWCSLVTSASLLPAA